MAIEFQQSANLTGPLSYGQRALWFLQQLAPDNCAYNISVAARITGPLDSERLAKAFQFLVDRHGSLRTIFPGVKGKPIQLVQHESRVRFAEQDSSMLSWVELKAQLSEECQTPFNLETGPLLRVFLFRRPGSESVLLLVVHHIVVDYSSVLQLLRELGRFYSSECRGISANLPQTVVSYLDYSNWQNGMLAGSEGVALWEYWSRRLSGDLPVIDLPFDRTRQQIQTFRGDTYNLDLGKHPTSNIRRLVSAVNGSLFTVLLAAFFCALHLCTGQDDILVGSPPIGRRKQEFEGVVGFFHNPVVLRSSSNARQSFNEFHRGVASNVREAFEHQDFPFSYLVERLKPARHPSYSPIFQVMFVLYEAEVGAASLAVTPVNKSQMELEGLGVEFLEIEEPVSMLDLTMTIVEESESLAAGVQYNTDLFERSTIESITRDFAAVLSTVTKDPNVKIADLPCRTGRRSAELAREDQRQIGVVAPGPSRYTLVEQRPPALSLFWSGREAIGGQSDQSLLIDLARLADSAGFEAIWLPPEDDGKHASTLASSAVTAAAIAALTKRVQIRAAFVSAGSANPVRVAEEWSVVDNLSHGRVGVAFARLGTRPQEAYDSKNNSPSGLQARIELVRKLWRGEAATLPGVDGVQVTVRTLPRPIQSELPIWVTASNQDDAILTGTLGANMLIHAYERPMEQVNDIIRSYRRSFAAAGTGSGRVALVVPAFVSRDETVCAAASSLALRNLFEGLSTQDQNSDGCAASRAILCGPPDRCIDGILWFGSLDVDELVCRLDFGLDRDAVVSGFAGLRELVLWRKSNFPDASLPDLASNPSQSFSELASTDDDSVAMTEVFKRAQTRRELMKRQKRPTGVSIETDKA